MLAVTRLNDGRDLMSMFLMGTLLLAGQPAATAPSAPAAPSTSGRDKVKCKRELETGSLVKSRKTCRTVAEWDAIRRDSREFGEQLQNSYRPQALGPGG